jgi:cell wall-associated NlpC family hydrolase
MEVVAVWRAEGRGEAVAGAAEALVGVPFRLHGRDERGLDCVGLVALALARGGVAVGAVPSGYGLRGGDMARIGDALGATGLVRVDAAARGDVLLGMAGPGQWHLALAVGAGRVAQAHAGLRRVVIGPLVCYGVVQ